MKGLLLVLSIVVGSFNLFGQKDTTTKAQADTMYQLIGKMSDFQVLYVAVVSPDDISPNQRKAIAAWLQKIQAIVPPKQKTKQ